MADTALHDLTLAQAAALIKARKLSPVEYTRALIARTDALDPQLNAYITAPTRRRLRRPAPRKPRSRGATTAGRCTASRSP